MKRRKPKLTPTTTIKIQERRRAGASYVTLAREFGCSQGSIRNALTAPAAAAPAASVTASAPAPAPTLTEPSAAPPTLDELRSWLGDQVRALRADVEATTDAPSRAAANRSLVATQALLTRIMPPEKLSPEVGVFVSAEEMIAMRAEASRKWHEMIDLVAEGDAGAARE